MFFCVCVCTTSSWWIKDLYIATMSILRDNFGHRHHLIDYNELSRVRYSSHLWSSSKLLRDSKPLAYRGCALGPTKWPQFWAYMPAPKVWCKRYIWMTPADISQSVSVPCRNSGVGGSHGFFLPSFSHHLNEVQRSKPSRALQPPK